MHVGYRVRKQVLGHGIRPDPIFYTAFRHHQRHAVMDETDLVNRLLRKDDEFREAVRDAIQAAQPGGLFAGRLDHVLVACLGFAGTAAGSFAA